LRPDPAPRHLHRKLDLMSGVKSALPCCLVVEDQALIGMALEASLEDAGFKISGPFGRVCDALKWLKTHTPDIALLDLVLGDGPCTQLATTLRERGVPFAIYSGVRPPAIRPPEFDGVPWLEKPVSRSDLAAVLADLARTSAAGRLAVVPVPAGCA
jgi:DNA-binding response OmpR family regulator